MSAFQLNFFISVACCLFLVLTSLSDMHCGLFHVLKSVHFQKKPTSRKSTREYIPAFRSGPFALMLTLYRENQVRHMIR